MQFTMTLPNIIDNIIINNIIPEYIDTNYPDLIHMYLFINTHISTLQLNDNIDKQLNMKSYLYYKYINNIYYRIPIKERRNFLLFICNIIKTRTYTINVLYYSIIIAHAITNSYNLLPDLINKILLFLSFDELDKNLLTPSEITYSYIDIDYIHYYYINNLIHEYNYKLYTNYIKTNISSYRNILSLLKPISPLHKNVYPYKMVYLRYIKYWDDNLIFEDYPFLSEHNYEQYVTESH